MEITEKFIQSSGDTIAVAPIPLEAGDSVYFSFSEFPLNIVKIERDGRVIYDTTEGTMSDQPVTQTESKPTISAPVAKSTSGATAVMWVIVVVALIAWLGLGSQTGGIILMLLALVVKP